MGTDFTEHIHSNDGWVRLFLIMQRLCLAMTLLLDPKGEGQTRLEVSSSFIAMI